MLKMLKVTSRSSGVIQGQMRSNGVNIGGWGQLLMPKILKAPPSNSDIAKFGGDINYASQNLLTALFKISITIHLQTSPEDFKIMRVH